MIALILAGGSGSRLWPVSRMERPKQLTALLGRETLLSQTFKRLLPLIGAKRIFVATNRSHAAEARRQLPNLLPENIIAEPVKRNTGPAIGLAAILLHHRFPREVLVILPSDHYIGDEGAWRRAIKASESAAEDGYLTFLGIHPTDVDPGLGYIELGRRLDGQVSEVAAFHEKPSKAKATRFVTSGRYLWNLGTFIARADTFRDLYKELWPEAWKHLRIIEAGLGTQHERSIIEREYPKLPTLSFDYAIAEKAKRRAVISGTFSWSDIGNWASLLTILSKRLGENVVIGCDHVGVASTGCLIHGTERLVVTIGLKDVIVVDTPDAVLICSKRHAQGVRDVVERLERLGKKKYL